MHLCVRQDSATEFFGTGERVAAMAEAEDEEAAWKEFQQWRRDAWAWGEDVGGQENSAAMPSDTYLQDIPF